jgi:hypothetical protein
MSDVISESVEQHDVLRLVHIDAPVLTELCGRFGLRVAFVAVDQAIPGSYWGESEAGLQGSILFVRADTPLHSALHEACHFICMDSSRRDELSRDAGGEYDEENAVCYLQIILADHLTGMNRERMLQDMDGWGYTFRLGSARAWFEQEADDAREWLQREGLIDAWARPTWRVRIGVAPALAKPALAKEESKEVC